MDGFLSSSTVLLHPCESIPSSSLRLPRSCLVILSLRGNVARSCSLSMSFQGAYLSSSGWPPRSLASARSHCSSRIHTVTTRCTRSAIMFLVTSLATSRSALLCLYSSSSGWPPRSIAYARSHCSSRIHTVTARCTRSAIMFLVTSLATARSALLCLHLPSSLSEVRSYLRILSSHLLGT